MTKYSSYLPNLIARNVVWYHQRIHSEYKHMYLRVSFHYSWWHGRVPLCGTFTSYAEFASTRSDAHDSGDCLCRFHRWRDSVAAHVSSSWCCSHFTNWFQGDRPRLTIQKFGDSSIAVDKNVVGDLREVEIPSFLWRSKITVRINTDTFPVLICFYEYLSIFMCSWQ